MVMSEEDVDRFVRLRLSIQRALWGEVIPSQRQVMLKWQPGAETAWIMFYHDGEITDVVEEHYSCIATEVHADFVCEPYIDFQVIRCDYPQPLPKEEHTIYIRKEPFVDPK